MRRFFRIAAVMLSIYIVAITAYAHPGRTDGNGGHTNRSTGEYHYHHGYPEHDHYDMDGDGKKDCPYDFKSKTNSTSGNSGITNNPITPTTTTLPTKSSTSSTLSTSSSKKTPTGSSDKSTNPFRLGALIALIGIGAFFLVKSLAAESELRKVKEDRDNLRYKFEKLSKESKQLAAELANLKIRYNVDTRNLEQVKKAKEIKIKQLEQKLENAYIDIDKIYSEYPFIKDSPATSYLSHPISVPKDVYFINGTVPVKGRVGEYSPFGDFTVYTSTRGKRFHMDRYCGGKFYNTTHVYDILNTHSPCTKCATRSPFNQGEVPQWYKDCKELENLL